MSTTDPMPEQWTPDQVSSAFARGDYESIRQARYEGLLDAVLRPSREG